MKVKLAKARLIAAAAGLTLAAATSTTLATAPSVGTAFFTVTVDSQPLGSATWGGTQSLSPTVYFDNNTSTYHMWFMAGGTPTPDTASEAASLFEGDVTTYRHATSADGIHYTSTPGFVTYSADPGYAARGATTTPSMMFPRVSMTDNGLRLIAWTHNGGFPDASYVFGEYNYNASVNALDLSNPTVFNHLGPLNAPFGPPQDGADPTPISSFPGQTSSPMGWAQVNGVDNLFMERDTTGAAVAHGIYDDQISQPTYTQPTTTGDVTDFESDRFFQISRALEFLNTTVGAFTETAGWMGNNPPRTKEIQYAETQDGGTTWTPQGDLFGGNGATVTIDGLLAGNDPFDAPEAALANNGTKLLFMFTAFDNAGNLIVAGNVVDAPNTEPLPEPASLALLGAGGVLILRRHKRS